jgi:hypothetical protein
MNEKNVRSRPRRAKSESTCDDRAPCGRALQRRLEALVRDFRERAVSSRDYRCAALYVELQRIVDDLRASGGITGVKP